MKEKYGIIYKITNKINNKTYIGQTVRTFDERYNNDLKNKTHNKHLKSSINMYGINNFKIDKQFDVAYSKNELNKKEEYWIKYYNSTNPKYGYNFACGGDNYKRSYVYKLINAMRRNTFIYCIEDKNVFISSNQAGEFYNISAASIKSSANKGKNIFLPNKTKITIKKINLLESKVVINFNNNKLYLSPIEMKKDYPQINNDTIGSCCRSYKNRKRIKYNNTYLYITYLKNYLNGKKDINELYEYINN